MTKVHPAFYQQAFSVIDQKASDFTQLYDPFVYTDLLATIAGQERQAFIHFWQLDKTVILGMKDTRLKALKNGLKTITEAGFQPIVRNSGGLAVVADQGVLNMTLIFPKEHLANTSVDYAYEQVQQLLSLAFSDTQIAAYEVKDSYCPGTFDLSIHGKKFAGCAQRRVKNGIAIMIYISVTGNQLARGNLIQRFYEASLAKESAADYPDVNPNSMANLADLLAEPLTVAQVKAKLLKTLQEQEANIQVVSINQMLDSEKQKMLAEQRVKMANRNKILSLEEESK